MTTDTNANDFFSSDAAFDKLYSLRAQQLSSMHWTPLDVALKAATHLAAMPGQRVLDIGSGVGKFCIAAAHYFPDSYFYGVEQRKALVDEAIFAQNATNTVNAKFFYANFNELDMDQFDHFYFYNSFSENIVHHKPIDNLIPTSAQIYEEYLAQFYQLLEDKPVGTRLAAYHCPDNYIPPSYKSVHYSPGQTLSLWVKAK